MNFIEVLKILFLGAIEGITEWLPVSSTGHMLLIDEVCMLTARDIFKEMFFVVIQLGAILAVLVLFFKQLFPLKRIVLENGKPTLVWEKHILRLWGKVLVACLPAAIIGLFFDDLIENLLHTKQWARPLVISFTLIIYGAFFILIENKNKGKLLPIKTADEITYKQALIIGAFQVLSLIPGTSRSGATIIGALLLGISRPAGASFTFYLAIPVMFGASTLKFVKFLLNSGGFLWLEIGYLLIGVITAFAVSLFTIQFLMNFVKKHDFKIFGWYRIALGFIVIATLVIPAFIG